MAEPLTAEQQKEPVKVIEDAYARATNGSSMSAEEVVATFDRVEAAVDYIQSKHVANRDVDSDEGQLALRNSMVEVHNLLRSTDPAISLQRKQEVIKNFLTSYKGQVAEIWAEAKDFSSNEPGMVLPSTAPTAEGGLPDPRPPEQPGIVARAINTAIGINTTVASAFLGYKVLNDADDVLKAHPDDVKRGKTLNEIYEGVERVTDQVLFERHANGNPVLREDEQELEKAFRDRMADISQKLKDPKVSIEEKYLAVRSFVRDCKEKLPEVWTRSHASYPDEPKINEPLPPSTNPERDARLLRSGEYKPYTPGAEGQNTSASATGGERGSAPEEGAGAGARSSPLFGRDDVPTVLTEIGDLFEQGTLPALAQGLKLNARLIAYVAEARNKHGTPPMSAEESADAKKLNMLLAQASNALEDPNVSYSDKAEAAKKVVRNSLLILPGMYARAHQDTSQNHSPSGRPFKHVLFGEECATGVRGGRTMGPPRDNLFARQAAFDAGEPHTWTEGRSSARRPPARSASPADMGYPASAFLTFDPTFGRNMSTQPVSDTMRAGSDSRFLTAETATAAPGAGDSQFLQLKTEPDTTAPASERPKEKRAAVQPPRPPEFRLG